MNQAIHNIRNRHIVEDWKNARKWISVRAWSLAIVLQLAWMGMIHSGLDTHVPNQVGTTVSVLVLWLSIWGLAGRLIKQDGSLDTTLLKDSQEKLTDKT